MSLSNKIGVMTNSFRTDVREALRKAKEVGADGVQIHAVRGEMVPENLSTGDRKELKAYIDSLGLEVAALCGDLGGHGFQDKAGNAEKIEKSKRILDLALELGTNVITSHIGLIPEETESVIYEDMQKACYELGEIASRANAYFAIETGPESAWHLKQFLDSLGTKGIAVNFDPANMVMVLNEDPVEGIDLLKDHLVHTHVKDGVQYKPVDPKDVYGLVGHERSEALTRALQAGEIFKEVPLGEGNVNFDTYFAKLQEIGYTGYLTIERETGDQPAHDIRQAVEFIKRYK